MLFAAMKVLSIFAGDKKMHIFH